MNVDGISYLDLGDAFYRHHWRDALNAWWSPLYAWVMGIVLGLVKPSAGREFPLAHAVNFVIFLLALLAFRFLLHGLLEWNAKAQAKEDSAEIKRSLPAWAFAVLGYGVFWWSSLQIETVYEVTPDLAVLACVCLAGGMLLRLRLRATGLRFVLLGLVLGLGYYVKAIFFPLSLVILASGFFWNRSSGNWRRGFVIAFLFFTLASAPLIFLLSRQKHRFTFGDSGRINYAWYVSPRTPTRNWQGEIPGSGIPAHPTRQLLKHPALFEFDGPVAGTYPPWTDPSYWNEGLEWHFNLRAQIEVFASTIPSEARLLLRERPEIVVGLAVLALLSGRSWLRRLKELFPLLATAAAGMALYIPLVENDRYLGGFVLLVFLVCFTAVQVPSEARRATIYVVAAVFAMLALGTADYMLRIATNHLAISGDGPNSTAEDVLIAGQLRQMGLQPEDKVAVIGDGTGAFWARLGKLRIVAEIMGGNRGYNQFWRAPENIKEQVYETFLGTGAKVIVSSCGNDADGGWERIPGSSYCLFPLTRNQWQTKEPI